MDTEQEEMQFLGVYGIYHESFKIISSWRKIFSQITVAFVLPLSFIFLLHIQVSSFLFRQIKHDQEGLLETQQDTPQFEKRADILHSEWATFLLFKLAYLTFFLILSLLSTSAVVYTVASIYTGRDLSFKKVLSVVPKVWKKLMVTFLYTFMAFFLYNLVAILILVIMFLTISIHQLKIFAIPGGVVYFVGFLYLTIVWQLASVVSVLEDSYGLQAMVKSQQLIKGKMGVAIAIFLKLNLLFFLIEFAFKNIVVHGRRVGTMTKVSCGMLFFMLVCMFILFMLVIQTVYYFVCKSYHHENIDKSALSDHLEVYLLAEYVPLKTKDVQLEQVNGV